MAPSLIQPISLVADTVSGKASDPPGVKEVFSNGPAQFNSEGELKGVGHFAPASYPDYLPTWNNEQGQKYVA